MKKRLSILFFLILAGAALKIYWPQVQKLVNKAPQLVQQIAQSPTISSIKQQVLNGGALRSTQDSKGAFLTREGTIKYTNLARQQNGNLPALAENSLLDEDASSKLADMFARQYFEHVSPDGKGPADQAKTVGYDYVVIGENLALGNFANDQALVNAWMNSPGHRANILNVKYQDIGVAVGRGIFEGKSVWLAVQEFGKPASSCPTIDPNLKNQISSLQSDISSITPQLQSLKSQIDNYPQPHNQQQVDAYNALVSQYNNLVKIYNNKVDQLKSVVLQYNVEVNAFNACAQ